MTRKHKTAMWVVAFALSATLLPTIWGQGRGQRNGPGPRAGEALQMLDQQLTKAGAATLDPNQRAALQLATTTFRDSIRQIASDPAQKAARDDYNNAILAGDNHAAKMAADKLAGLMSSRQQKRLEAEAEFGIKVLSILNSGQVAALQSSVGKEGLIRILGSLVRPGSPLGGGPAGRGPMGPRSQRSTM